MKISAFFIFNLYRKTHDCLSKCNICMFLRLVYLFILSLIVVYLMNYLSLCLLFIISLSFLCVKSYLNFGTFGGTSKVIILFLFLIGFSS